MKEYPKSLIRQYGHDFDSFIAYDFETTGLSSTNHEIIEIGAVKVIRGEISEKTYVTFVKPERSKVTPFITQLTGIKPEDVENARRMKEVLPEFLAFCEDLPLVGYNSACFDSKFLLEAARRNEILISNKGYDVIYLARSKHLPVPNHKLNTIAAYYHVINPRAHRALADAITTAKVFMALKKDA